MPVECEGDDPARPLSFTIRPEKWRELLPYWLCRVTAAMNESAAHFRKGGSLQGIYDSATRSRLHACLVQRGAHRTKEPLRTYDLGEVFTYDLGEFTYCNCNLYDGAHSSDRYQRATGTADGAEEV